MKQITRTEASRMLRQFGAIDTRIERDKNALLVHSLLSNNRSLLIKYDMKRHQKRYFIVK